MSGNASRMRGRARELAYLKHLKDQGYAAWRIDGTADLIALKAGEQPVLLQVKSTLRPYSCFMPAERQALRQEAEAAGAICALLWWPKGRGLDAAVWVDSSEWPAERAIAA